MTGPQILAELWRCVEARGLQGSIDHTAGYELGTLRRWVRDGGAKFLGVCDYAEALGYEMSMTPEPIPMFLTRRS